MLDTLIQQVVSTRKFDIVVFNAAVDNLLGLIEGGYRGILSETQRLNKIVGFKNSEFGRYSSKITKILDSLEMTLSNKHQSVVPFPLNHHHFIDQAKSTAKVDTKTETAQINQTVQTYKLPLYAIVDSDRVSYFVSNAKDVDSTFLEYGSSVPNLLRNSYNYFRFVARSKSQNNFTFVLEVPIPEQEIGKMLLNLRDIVTLVDRVKVGYTNTTNAIQMKYVLDQPIVSNNIEAIIADKANKVRVEITKTSHDGIVFENGFAYFDYYFTIQLFELFNHNYYRQNLLVTKPLSFGTAGMGDVRNSVKFRVESSMPEETDIRYYYLRAKRGMLGDIQNFDITKMTAIREGDSIDIIPTKKVVISKDVAINRLFNDTFVYLSASVPAREILNGSIDIFRGVDQYQTVATSFYRFWLVYTGSEPLEVDFDTYCSGGFLDAGQITKRRLYLTKGFYKLGVLLRDYSKGDPAKTVPLKIEDYINYLKSMSSDVYIARDKLVFGLPSQVLPNEFDSAFTIYMRDDNTIGDVLVSTPKKEDLGLRYLIIYDKRSE